MVMASAPTRFRLVPKVTTSVDLEGVIMHAFCFKASGVVTYL